MIDEAVEPAGRDEAGEQRDRVGRLWWRRWLVDPAPLALVLALGGWLVARLASAGALGRAFFLDEAWRAYFVSLPRDRLNAELSRIDIPLSWGFLESSRLAVRLFGNTERTMRGSVLFLLPLVGVATYLLARRVAGVVVSLLVSLALLCNTGLLVYSTFYKQYTAEVLATALVLVLWDTGRRREGPDWVWWATTVAAGALGWYATTALFVLVPLAGVELLTGGMLLARSRPRWPGPLLAAAWRPVTAAVLLLVPAAVHAAVWLRPQSGHVTTRQNIAGYWFFAYPPRHGSLPTRLTWAVRMLRGFVPGFAVNGYPQPRDAGNLGVPPAHASVGGTIVAVATVLALVAGIAAARRIVLVRVLLVVLLGALLGMYLLARRHQWPFIWGRTSLFLLPLGYVVLAAGLSELWRWLRTSAAMALRSGAGWQRLAAAFTTACLAGGLLLSAAAGVVVTRVAARDLHGMTETLPRANTGLRDVGELVRSGARPGDLVVFELQGRPLTYYLLYHRGSAGPASTPVRAGDVASVNQFDSPQTIDFVRHHAGAGQVWIFQYVGVGARAYQDEVAAMRHIGYRPQQVTHVPSTGVLTRYRRAGTR